MDNLPILPKEKGYKSEKYKICFNISTKLIQQVFINNAYLLKKRNKTLACQVKELEREGISISISNISKYKAGVKGCNLTFLIFFANYWNIPLPKLMSIDFEMTDRLNAI